MVSHGVSDVETESASMFERGELQGKKFDKGRALVAQQAFHSSVLRCCLEKWHRPV